MCTVRVYLPFISKQNTCIHYHSIDVIMFGSTWLVIVVQLIELSRSYEYVPYPDWLHPTFVKKQLCDYI